tara:strand:- start:656 stop:967 length:312 start_codon:yes stop_codon:yes gene_type:complete
VGLKSYKEDHVKVAKKPTRACFALLRNLKEFQRADTGTPLSCSSTNYGGFGKCLIYPPSTISLVDGDEPNTLTSCSGAFLFFIVWVGLKRKKIYDRVYLQEGK